MKIRTILISGAIIASSCFNAFAQEPVDKEYEKRLKKINAAFEDFGRAYYTLLDYYVNELDPEALMEQAIKGMASSLDPYTELLNDTDAETFEALASNKFTGVGIYTSPRDSMLTIVDVVSDSPAKKAGLRVGDRIYSVDGNIVLNSSDDRARKYLRGKSGVPVTLKIIRDGRKDTLNYEIIRGEVPQKSLGYYGLIGDTVAYIQIKDFSGDTRNEVKNAYLEMKNISGSRLKSLVIDLRNNSGGLMMSAVDLFELFMPLGSYFGGISNRNENKNQIYSNSMPVDAQIPMAIIVNEYSASASEFFAAAMQDLDRAVIVGEKTFGKGISQIIKDLPSGKNLKLTVDKFSAPSGRVFNTVNINSSFNKKDTTKNKIDSAFSKNGRILFASSAITPDSIVKEKAISPLVMELLSKDVIFNYANLITSNMSQLPNDFELNDSLFSQFKSYADSCLTNGSTILDNTLIAIKKQLGDSKYPQELIDKLQNLTNDFKKYYSNSYEDNKTILSKMLKAEIISRFNDDREVMKFMLQDDEYLSCALDMLKREKYESVLRISSSVYPKKGN
jgi:carboxyl-terminal processing protease